MVRTYPYVKYMKCPPRDFCLSGWGGGRTKTFLGPKNSENPGRGKINFERLLRDWGYTLFFL